ncbi:Chaperone protein DnaK [Bienertia sinuspersici]
MRITASMMLATALREKKPPPNSMMVINNNIVNVNYKKQQHRMMVGRANNRSGVHGTHLPATDTLRNADIEKEINKGKKKKEEERKKVEETVDSQLSNSGQHPKSPTK